MTPSLAPLLGLGSPASWLILGLARPPAGSGLARPTCWFLSLHAPLLFLWARMAANCFYGLTWPIADFVGSHAPLLVLGHAPLLVLGLAPSPHPRGVW